MAIPKSHMARACKIQRVKYTSRLTNHKPPIHTRFHFGSTQTPRLIDFNLPSIHSPHGFFSILIHHGCRRCFSSCARPGQQQQEYPQARKCSYRPPSPSPSILKEKPKQGKKERKLIHCFFFFFEYRPRSVTPSSQSRESTRHNGRRERFSKSTLPLLQRSPRAR